MKDEFWNRLEGQRILWRRRWLRTRRLRIAGEPEQKARRGGGHRTARMQRSLIEQLVSLSQQPLTGPVALDVRFHSGRAQPPGPHRLAKHLLDVLGALTADAGLLGRRHVLYRDDRQVKLLYVSLWALQLHGTPSTPHTSITARPLRDVVADLTMCRSVEEESNGKGWTDEQDSPFFMPPIPDIDPEPAFDSRLAQSAQQAVDWRKLNAELACFEQRMVQQALLSRSDALLTGMLCVEAIRIAGSRPPRRQYADHPNLYSAHTELDRVHAEYRDMLLSGPVTFDLPKLPRTAGEGKEFRAALERAVEVIATGRPAFTTVRVPLKVILLVVAPIGQGKDLDNLALVVLPVVQQVLNSPMIRSYEVIELARTTSDPPEGHLRIVFGDGAHPRSTWERATQFVERIMERC